MPDGPTPTPATPTAPKLCHLCGQDCAERPRSKDRKGRYICQSCMDAALERQRQADLEAEAAAVICTSCGFSRDAGRRIRTVVGDLGAPVDKRQAEREASRRAWRLEYIRPLVMFGVSYIVLLVLLGANGAAAEIPFRTFQFGIDVVIGLGVFWLCSLVYIDVDSQLDLTAVRLLGIYGIVGTVSIAMVIYVTNPWIMFLTPTILYLALLCRFLDMDLGDALVLAMVTGILRPFVYLVLKYL